MKESSQTGKARSTGFTLLEALVVLTLLAVLLGLVAPGLSGLRSRQQLQARAEDFWGSLMLARAQAVLLQQHVTVCAASAAGLCDAGGAWHDGWIVFADGNRNGQIEPGERVLLQRAAVAGVFIAGNSTVDHVMGYGANGRSENRAGGFQAGTIRICSPGQAEGWQVVINAVGRPRLEKAGMPGCP
jgi:type IV fimbrial biogenesis protein FimT